MRPRVGIPSGVEVGRLAHRSGAGQGYVLLDEGGRLKAYLAAHSSLDMGPYLGQNVAVKVRSPGWSPNRLPRLWVSDIQAVENINQEWHADHPFDAGGGVALVQYQQPVFQETDVPGSPAEWNGLALPAMRWSSNSHGRRHRLPLVVWGKADYLLWWGEGMAIPPLVTTSTTGTPREIAGVLGEPSTRILLGNENILSDLRDGWRIETGIWCDQNRRWGVQADWLGLNSEDATFFQQSDTLGNPILARPFFNINPRNPFTLVLDPPAREDSRLLSFPESARGQVVVGAGTTLRSLGIDIRRNLARDLICNADSRVDLIAGYRYVGLNDQLTISDFQSSLELPTPGSLQVFDEFGTRNEFHGAETGVVWQAGWNRCSLECLLKTAVGNVHQVVNIQGSTTITPADSPAESLSGGLLAQQSNMGSHARDRFGVIPEVGIDIGYQVLPGWRLRAGYRLLYWNTVVRAGHQIDRDLNPDQVPPPIEPSPGAPRPSIVFRDSGFWAQGLNLGFEGSW